MRKKYSITAPAQIKGFSLIELLVAMAIALVIIGAALSAFIGSSGSRKIAEAQSRMNEDAQAALSILSQQIRMAGNNPAQPNRVDDANPALSSLRNPVYGVTSLNVGTYTTSNFSVRGCDGKFTNLTTATNLDALTCAGGTTTLPDSIGISYEADKYNSIATNKGAPTDCLGISLPPVTATLPVIVGNATTTANVTFTVADNRFYIGTSSAIKAPTLWCKGTSTAQPLVENIEDMQFHYGTVSAALTATTATVAGYLKADDVVNETTLKALPTDAQKWSKVVTVRICVIVRSEEPVAPDLASAQYLNCDGDLVTNPPDLRLRKAYSTLVMLKNRRM